MLVIDEPWASDLKLRVVRRVVLGPTTLPSPLGVSQVGVGVYGALFCVPQSQLGKRVGRSQKIYGAGS